MPKPLRVSCFAFVLAALTSAAVYFSNPLRRSDREIEVWLLELTPLHTPAATVQKVIQNHGWKTDEEQSDAEERGSMIHAQLGWWFDFPWKYGCSWQDSWRFGLLWYEIHGTWGFGPDGRLIKVEVDERMDLP
jgi:hypothetical protein